LPAFLFKSPAPAKGLAAIAATTPVDAVVRNSRRVRFVLFMVGLIADESKPASGSVKRAVGLEFALQGCIKLAVPGRSCPGTPALAGRFSRFLCRCRMNAAFRAGLMQPSPS
jgi:hypothetical protein